MKDPAIVPTQMGSHHKLDGERDHVPYADVRCDKLQTFGVLSGHD